MILWRYYLISPHELFVSFYSKTKNHCIVRFSSFVDLFGNFHLADRWKLCIEHISNRNHDQLRQYPTSVKAYSQPGRTSSSELFAKIINRFYPLTIFAKGLILDVRVGSEYVSILYNHIVATTTLRRVRRMVRKTDNQVEFISVSLLFICVSLFFLD